MAWLQTGWLRKATWAALIFLMVVATVRAVEPVRLTSGRNLSGRTVVIDPGHGGPDGGAAVNGIEEKVLTLAVARELGSLLTRAGINVVYTRTDDSDLAGLEGVSLRRRKATDLRRRTEIGNSSGADVFISIHANKFPQSRYRGTQTFYFSGGHPESKRLAELIQAELNRLPANRRAANEGVETYLLKNIRIPVVTVEIGFMSNPEELVLLTQEKHQRALSWGIFTGVCRFFADESLPGPPSQAP